MNRFITSLFCILIISCSTEPKHNIHDDIIQQDLKNKQQELNILRELRLAQSNDDEEAFKFFVTEYVRVPRLVLTHEQKQHPDYKAWITDEIIRSDDLMDAKYDYIADK